MSVWRHLRAIGLLPVTVAVVVPGLILWRGEAELGAWPLATAGIVLIAIGLVLVSWTVALFAVNAVYFPLVEEPGLR